MWIMQARLCVYWHSKNVKKGSSIKLKWPTIFLHSGQPAMWLFAPMYLRLRHCRLFNCWIGIAHLRLNQRTFYSRSLQNMNCCYVGEMSVNLYSQKDIWRHHTLNQGNVEHCGASVSKQCTVALNCYVAKTLPVKYQITAHMQAMHGI